MPKRGAALELGVLGLLHESPMHGYELRKRVNALFGWSRVLSYGTLYPCLKQLLRAGLVEADAGPGGGEPRRAGRRRRQGFELCPVEQGARLIAGRRRDARRVAREVVWLGERLGAGVRVRAEMERDAFPGLRPVGGPDRLGDE